MSLTALDIIIAACFIPAIFRGLRKGLCEQITNVIALVAGSFIAIRFSSLPVKWASSIFPGTDGKILQAACFIVLLIISAILITLIGKAISRGIGNKSLGWLDKLFGIVLSAFATFLILCIVFYVFGAFNDKLNLVSGETLHASPLYNMIEDFIKLIHA